MMKHNFFPTFSRMAALLLVVLAAACTADDDGFITTPSPDSPATSAPPLTITVTDGAYAPAPTANDEDDATAPATRAVERGFATEFTEGDQIGLYEVIEKEHGDGESLYDVITKNLCLTYDGTAWTLPTGAKLTPERPTDGRRTHYYAYYPWQKDEDMVDKVVGDDGKVFTNPSGTPFTPQEFFARLISDWYPALDQSTYAAYTASDLMVSLGTVTQRTDGTDGSELRFEMEHQMALAVVRVPSTEYTYSETISGSNTEKSYRLYTGMNTGVCWQENSHTARLLVNPQYGTTLLMGYYYTAELKKCSFSVMTVGRGDGTPGTYRLYTIDRGEAEVKERPLKEGDFYMRDGSILPQEAAKDGDLPADVRADCLGVVFWVGENEGEHWTQTDRFDGDHLLMRHHPECTRGMAVALHDASQGAAWATGEGAGEDLYDWADGFDSFTPAEQADWKEIKVSDSGYGYRGSRLMKLYGAYHSTTAFPAYDEIDTYAAAHPAPDGSSGWFFPCRRELAMMCYGMAANFAEKPPARRDLLDNLFRKAGGEAFDGIYWSSRDGETKAWTIDFAGSTRYEDNPKSNTYRVRPVIAF
ncbi:fimbrillin family protein [Bacteroides uniformis]|uniref:fimbrillin family protein n=1 Tax=Bacteroides uniformis TaxID=820 RepID=UPI001896F193|nr:fimbrillin family protein [Bacteroides uniformis]